MKDYIVELQSNVWISSWGVTLVREHAKKYPSISSATYALARQRRNHDFVDAKIQEADHDGT